MRKSLSLILIFLICACGSAAPVPKWQSRAYEQLDIYKTSFLTGREASTEPHFVLARREIAAAGDLHLLAIAYLTKYALHTASLESFDAADFSKIYRLEPDAANLAYCHFLKGNFNAVDGQALPARYTGVLKAASLKDQTAAAREIAAIDDPLSRLVACGVWVRYLPSDETILQIGIATSSAHGWRRPLWAYLTKMHDFYRENGDEKKAQAVTDRLELLKKEFN